MEKIGALRGTAAGVSQGAGGMSLSEAVGKVVGLNMRGLLVLPAWASLEDMEELDEALRALSIWAIEERERQLGRC